MMNIKKMSNMNFVIIVIVVGFLMYLLGSTSGYLNPAPVKTNISDDQFSNFFSRMTKLGPELRCNPGSADTIDPKTGKRVVQSSYYTGGLLPGGYCDDQAVVSSAMDYKLVGSDAVLGD